MDPRVAAHFHQQEVMDMNIGHFKFLYQDGRWYCDLCQKSVTHSYQRGRHFKEQHNPAAPVFECPECSYVRTTKENLLENALV